MEALADTASPAVETSVAPEPAASSDYSQLTDDQVLDTPSVSPPAQGEDAAPAAGEPTTPVEGDSKAVETPVEEPYSEAEQPEVLKQILAATNIPKDFKKFARDTYFPLQAFREQFQTVAEARELRSLFPSNTEAQAAIEGAQQHQAMVDLINAPDPESHASIVREIYQTNPAAVQNIASEIATNLWDINPTAYTGLAEKVVGDFVQNVAAKAAYDGNEELLAALRVVEGYRQGLPKPAPAQQAPASNPWREKAESIEMERNQEFGEGCVSVARGELEKEVGSIIDKSDIGAISPKARQEIISQITGDIANKMQSNKQLTDLYTQRVLSGKRDSAHRAEIVKFLTNQARLLLPKAAKDRLSLWGEIFSTKSREAIQKGQAGVRTDVGRGGSAPPETKQPLTKAAAAKMSDDEILNY